MKIVPSILAENFNDFLPLIRQAESFADCVQIDLMDGGVSLANLDLFIEAGVDYACVGSSIFLRGNASENYRELLQKIKKLEGVK